ncbi:hypothetical protein [Streptomyces sp. NPDC020983]|uniref:hypothetical protein n=1 Tax=Streptomyces sp. NPDC020983 TaxID=3365106 RepID=UPI0037ACA88A
MTALSPADRTGVIEEARAALDAFLDGLNSHDMEQWTATLHFPQIRVHEGAVTVWQTAEEYLKESQDDLTALLASGWRRSGWLEVGYPQVSAEQVHATVRFGRYDAGGGLLGVFDSVYVVTREEGRWGVLARIGFDSGTDAQA